MFSLAVSYIAVRFCLRVSVTRSPVHASLCMPQHFLGKNQRHSICWCGFLEVLEANDNYLEKLPAKLGDMKRLKHLRYKNIQMFMFTTGTIFPHRITRYFVCTNKRGGNTTEQLERGGTFGSRFTTVDCRIHKTRIGRLYAAGHVLRAGSGLHGIREFRTYVMYTEKIIGTHGAYPPHPMNFGCPRACRESCLRLSEEAMTYGVAGGIRWPLAMQSGRVYGNMKTPLIPSHQIMHRVNISFLVC